MEGDNNEGENQKGDRGYREEWDAKMGIKEIKRTKM